MPRPRDFDTAVVLDRVADVFTEHGFHGTSMATLTDATGLGKQSLYNAFGDKESLYLQAVDHSGNRFGRRLDAMASAKTGREAIDVFFSVLLGVCMSDKPSENNCIVSSGLLEGIEAGGIADKLQEKWQFSRQHLRSAVARGQKDGSIRADVPALELADMLMTLMSGLRVSARAMQQKHQLKKITKLSLGVLDPS